MYELDLPKGYNPEAEALMILEICKDIERRMGRTGEPQYDEKGERIYSDRPIDIDILLFGDNKIDCPELTVPHKLMYERDFVMKKRRDENGYLTSCTIEQDKFIQENYLKLPPQQIADEMGVSLSTVKRIKSGETKVEGYSFPIR